ncbi:MAG TPA: RNA polymerase sigma factor [Pyrinomonadaceae bacterium]|nr:RNA polymerase sigma factor [Pyrinomonadaceae bacterium]
MTVAMKLVMKASGPTDSELVRRLVDGDKEAFAELYHRRHGSIYRFALHMTGRPEMADDVAQETFMVLMKNGAAYDEKRGSVSSFLLGVARNQVLSRLRQERPTAPLDEHFDEIDCGQVVRGYLTSFARQERIDAVRKAILSLPEHYREVVVLCELQEISYAETAHILNCAVGTVRSRLHRARAMLADKLEPVRNENSAAETLNSTRCFA